MPPATIVFCTCIESVLIIAFDCRSYVSYGREDAAVNTTMSSLFCRSFVGNMISWALHRLTFIFSTRYLSLRPHYSKAYMAAVGNPNYRALLAISPVPTREDGKASAFLVLF